MAFHVVALNALLKNYDENIIKKEISKFQCNLNPDVSYFIATKAIEFEKVGMARTTLVYVPFKGEDVLVGYFSISNKSLSISKHNWSKITKSVRRKLLPMGYKTEQDNYNLQSILLGQFAKNDCYRQQKLITGNELMSIANEKIKVAWHVSGGNLLYLEAENEPHIRDFYINNGFSQLFIKEKVNDKKPNRPYVTKNGLQLYIKKLSDL